MRAFYDAAVEANPHGYANYPFSHWLSFLKSWTLVREDGTALSITVRGREFLKYLVDTGRDADQRFN